MDKYVIVLDTETANTLEDPLVYDIGFAVINTENGNIVESHSFAVSDFFFDKELMNSAYYKEKIPSYWDEIREKERTISSLQRIRFLLYDICKHYNIKIIAAHNARFDNRSCNLSQRYRTSSKHRFFFPYGVEIWDTLKMAKETFRNNEEYSNFCKENNYLTKRGLNRYTAEILYRFISGNNDFKEVHKGLEDVKIEKEIFMYCLKKNPEIDGNLFKKKN